jgi:hypothetical protein
VVFAYGTPAALDRIYEALASARGAVETQEFARVLL